MGALALPADLLAALRERGGSPDRGVVEGVRRLSELFTTGRDGRFAEYLADRSLRRAYLLYFFPVNYAKVAGLLREMPALPARPLRILDVGSGPGTASLAALEHLMRLGQAGHHGSEVIAADRSRQALQEAEALWASMTKGRPDESPWALRMVCADAERADARAPWHEGPFDLIILANSLNELFCAAADPVADRAKFLEALLKGLAPDGTLMIIEPALRGTTRALHHVRDRLVAGGLATVYSPCLHEKPCPALVREDDWCHEERPWTPPAVVREIDRAVGFIKDALKFSYLLLRKDGLTVAERSPRVYRVVSEVMVMKGDRRAWLCNETGRPLVGRLEKARSDANAAFDRWHRGAIVRVDQIEGRSTVSRIGASAGVELIRSIIVEGGPAGSAPPTPTDAYS
ncbi:MAG: methyltransferase domain-containing protein [Nitrospirae bacterium]|nr:MAG: methyltransferase domain-containing protein [Nitrospirota bacterium]